MVEVEVGQIYNHRMWPGVEFEVVNKDPSSVSIKWNKHGSYMIWITGIHELKDYIKSKDMWLVNDKNKWVKTPINEEEIKELING